MIAGGNHTLIPSRIARIPWQSYPRTHGYLVGAATSRPFPAIMIRRWWAADCRPYLLRSCNLPPPSAPANILRVRTVLRPPCVKEAVSEADWRIVLLKSRHFPVFQIAPCRGRYFLAPTRKYPKNRLRGGASNVVYPPWAEIEAYYPAPLPKFRSFSRIFSMVANIQKV